MTLNEKLDTLNKKLNFLIIEKNTHNVTIELKQKEFSGNLLSQETSFFVTSIQKKKEFKEDKTDSLSFDDEVQIEDCFTDDRCLKTIMISVKTKNDSLINSTLSFKFYNTLTDKTQKTTLRLIYGYLEMNGNIELRFTDRPWRGAAYLNNRNVVFSGRIKDKNLTGSISWYEYDDSKSLSYKLNINHKDVKVNSLRTNL